MSAATGAKMIVFVTAWLPHRHIMQQRGQTHHRHVRALAMRQPQRHLRYAPHMVKVMRAVRPSVMPSIARCVECASLIIRENILREKISMGARGGRHRGGAPARRDEGREGGVGVSGLTNEQVVLSPVVSEKSYSGIADGRYTFKVHPSASKPEIHDAVEAIFGVKVLKVNTLNRKGKRKRNRRTFTYGSRPDTKRAIVTLVEGQTIDLFQG